MLESGIKKIHFIGIGGAGMSAIAWILLQKGYSITGSDLAQNKMTRRLVKHGAKIMTGHDPAHVRNKDLVVISSAIASENPELVKARKLKIPVWRRAKALAAIMHSGKSIAVAGTHGKTTTTSMLTTVFEKSRLHPTSLIGGELNDIGGNAKLGAGEYVIAEADESDGSFLEMYPDIEIITNVELDHLDFYKNLGEIVSMFAKFVSNLKPDGVAIVCLDNAGVRKLLGSVERKCLTYGITQPRADVRAKRIDLMPLKSEFDVTRGGKNLGRVELNVPGRHNVLNALAVITAALECGIDFKTIQKSIKQYRGVKRRFQVKRSQEGILVIDDYAHHPSEVKATLKAARICVPIVDAKVFCVFQPHRYSRTMLLANQFASAFKDADTVIITDVYSAGESPIENVSGKTIFDKVCKKRPINTEYIPDMKDIPEFLLKNVKKGDMVLTLGAGNVWRVGEEFIKGLI